MSVAVVPFFPFASSHQHGFTQLSCLDCEIPPTEPRPQDLDSGEGPLKEVAWDTTQHMPFVLSATLH